MPRLCLLLLGVLLLPGCSGGSDRIVVLAPTPGADGRLERVSLRRCDDGGDGGVLIDGICL